MTYQLTPTWPRRISDGAYVNPDSNPEYLAWIAQGNTPAPYVAPPAPVPTSVPRRQGRRALLDAGLLATADALIAAMPSPARERAKIDWDDAQTFDRDNPLLIQLASALGLDDAAIDALFVAAAAVV